jgi:hypothetical protein
VCIFNGYSVNFFRSSELNKEKNGNPGARNSQGDQIGGIFAHLVSHYFGYFSENYRNSEQIIGLLFPLKSCVVIFIKIDWATLCAIFSKTHLVTLPEFFVKLFIYSSPFH